MYDSFYDDFDSFDDSEDIGGIYDGEDFDESVQSRRRAKQRARARVLARNRSNGQMVRKPPVKNVREAFSRVGTNIQKVDIENKVQGDLLGGAIKSQGSRIRGVETSQALSRVWDEVKEQFPDLTTNPVLKTLLPFASLLFLKPEKKGSGFESVISDPRFWGPAVASAIVLFNDNRNQEAEEVVITPGNISIPLANKNYQLRTIVKDRNGKILKNRTITFESFNLAKATVDATGIVTLVAAGKVTINATDKTSGISGSVLVEIT